MAALRETFVWRDHIGRLASVRFYVPDITTGTNLRGPFDNLSTAAFVIARGPYSTSAGPIVYPALQSFSTVFDKARLTMLDVNGLEHAFEIPAPFATMFQPDGVTVNLTFGAVAAWAAAMVANAVTGSNLAFQQLVAGRRVMSRISRRPIAAPNPSP